MRSTAAALIILLMPVAGHAGQTLCFQLADPNQPQLGRYDIKLSVQPSCTTTGAPSPSLAAVHGTLQGFDDLGDPSEGFLLAGTCEGGSENVFLVAPLLGGGQSLTVFGPSLATGTAQVGTITAPVQPVACANLDL